MTTLELTSLVETQDTDGDDDKIHWACAECYPEGEFALCGERLTGSPVPSDGPEVDCELCLLLDECPKCEW